MALRGEVENEEQDLPGMRQLPLLPFGVVVQGRFDLSCIPFLSEGA